MTDPESSLPVLPPIFMPEQAATAEGPDGRRLVFLYLPQAENIIRELLANPPTEYTYRWAYHAGQQVHILLVLWHDRAELGVAIPEGAGDSILAFMTGTCDLYLTLVPVQQVVQETMSHAEVQKIISGYTVPLPDLAFARRRG